VHGLIFFYLRKFLAIGLPSDASPDAPADASADGRRTTTTIPTARYLPTGVYPDAEAVSLLETFAKETGARLPDVVERFGEFLAPHLLKVGGTSVDPRWTLLDLIEHTESIIHAMVRVKNPGATPPVLETLRQDHRELQLIYTSQRRLCRLAAGLIRGMARQLEEPVEIEETSCMLQGDPFCSFVIRVPGRSPGDETRRHGREGEETIVRMPGEASGGDFDVAVKADPSDPPSPRTIGGHRVIRLVGSGGMGHVWLAHDDRLDRNVAIKVMLPELAGDPVARERFLRESRSAAQIDHPHVVSIHDVGLDGGTPYLVMPFLDGRSLADRLGEEKCLPTGEALRIAQQIAAGLGAAHARGLVHRDVKPDNVFLIGPEQHVRLIDFGLARDTLLSGRSLTIDGTLLGTPAYMSPERISDGAIDGRADLFSLGVILYKMLSGRVPFEGRTPAAVLIAIAKGKPPSLGTVAPGIDPEVADFVMRLIADEPDDRPANADAVAAEIRRLRRTLGA